MGRHGDEERNGGEKRRGAEAQGRLIGHLRVDRGLGWGLDGGESMECSTGCLRVFRRKVGEIGADFADLALT